MIFKKIMQMFIQVWYLNDKTIFLLLKFIIILVSIVRHNIMHETSVDKAGSSTFDKSFSRLNFTKLQLFNSLKRYCTHDRTTWSLYWAKKHLQNIFKTFSIITITVHISKAYHKL